MTSTQTESQQQMQKPGEKTPAVTRTGQVERYEGLRAVAPAVDIYEGPDDTWVVADLPGVAREDLDIELQQNELRIRARAAEGVDEQAFVYARSFRLPPGVDGDKVKADLKDGVLTLKLPKPAELKPRKIDIRVG